MQKTILVLALLAVVGFSSVTNFNEMSSLWDAWKIQHQKSYTAQEEVTRFAVFTHNFKKIQQLNEEADGVTYAINKFADLTGNEFKQQQASCSFTETDPEIIASNLKAYEVEALPASVDWRNKGAVTPIKNQGQCGSCWTFSTTGVIEGFHFINTGKLLSFSEQQIVDCDTTTNQGCDGGYPYLAIQYAAKEGLELESEYPYTAADGTCQYSASKATTGLCSGYSFVTPDSTDQLKAAIVNGPVSISIEADQNAFQFYKTGVIKTGCGTNLDHAVLAVGYTTVGILEAVIVKNSWGTDWGEEGYVYIWDSQTINGGKGVCGILAQPVVPTK